MTSFVYRSMLALLLISFVLCLALLWKQDHQIKSNNIPVKSKYQMLPPADSMNMQHGTDTSHEMNMQEKLKSKVEFGDDSLSITNGDTKDWTDCMLEINQTVVKSGYTYHQDVFEAQKKVSIPYSSFLRDGQSFDASVTHPNNVMLMCGSQGNMTGWNFFSNR